LQGLGTAIEVFQYSDLLTIYLAHTCYFAMAAWFFYFSNFCHGFSGPFDSFSPKMESLRKK